MIPGGDVDDMHCASCGAFVCNEAIKSYTIVEWVPPENDRDVGWNRLVAVYCELCYHRWLIGPTGTLRGVRE